MNFEQRVTELMARGYSRTEAIAIATREILAAGASTPMPSQTAPPAASGPSGGSWLQRATGGFFDQGQQFARGLAGLFSDPRSAPIALPGFLGSALAGAWNARNAAQQLERDERGGGGGETGDDFWRTWMDSVTGGLPGGGQGAPSGEGQGAGMPGGPGPRGTPLTPTPTLTLSTETGEEKGDGYAPPPPAPPGSQTYPPWDPMKEDYATWYQRVFGTHPWKAPYDFEKDTEGVKEQYAAGPENPYETFTPFPTARAEIPYGTSEWWRQQDELGRYGDVYQDYLATNPAYERANPRWQEFLESRQPGLQSQFWFGQNFGPAVAGMADTPAATAPHYYGYLSGNPAVGAEEWWGPRMKAIFDATQQPGGAGATSPLGTALDMYGRDALSAGLRGGLHPFARGWANEMLDRRYRRWRTGDPSGSEASFFTQQYPQLSDLFGGGAAKMEAGRREAGVGAPHGPGWFNTPQGQRYEWRDGDWRVVR